MRWSSESQMELPMWKEARKSILGSEYEQQSLERSSIKTSNILPGISELRALDDEFVQRPIWARQDDESTSVDAPGSSSCQCGASPSFASIRFGSTKERLIHTTMRILALVELVGVTFICAFDVVYPLRRTMIVVATDVVLTSLFVLGLFARFDSSFVSQRDNLEVLDRQEIRQVLMNTWTSWVDVIAVLAAPLLYVRGFGGTFALLRLLKCWRLPRSTRRCILLDLHSKNALNEQIFVISIGIFVATHLYACIWFQAKVNSPPGFGHEWSAWNGWSVDVFEIERADRGSLSIPLEFGEASDLYICYARAFRDGAYMLISWAGPNAISSLELVTIGILSPLSGLIMAYVHALFVSSIEQAAMLEKQLVERMSVLGDACRDMDLPTDLQNRILRYHSFLSMHHLGAETQDLFQQLSANLTCEMRMFRMRNVICSANFFEGLSHRLVYLLVQTFVEQAFAPGDMVVRKGEVADCMYIILHGAVSVLIDGDKVATSMREGNVFGELCFVQEHMTRTAWIRAETYLVVWRFDKANFETLLDTHDEARTQMVSHILNRVKDFADFKHPENWSRKVSLMLEEDTEAMREIKAKFGPDLACRLSALTSLTEKSEDPGDSSSSSGLSSGETTPLMSRRSSERNARTDGLSPDGHPSHRESNGHPPQTISSDQSANKRRRRKSSCQKGTSSVNGGSEHRKSNISKTEFFMPTISLTGAGASTMRRASFGDISATQPDRSFALPPLLRQRSPEQASPFLDKAARRHSAPPPEDPDRSSETETCVAFPQRHSLSASPGIDPNINPNAAKVDAAAAIDHMLRRRRESTGQIGVAALASLDQMQDSTGQLRVCEATHKKVLELEKHVEMLGQKLQTDLESQQGLLLALASQLSRIEANLPGRDGCAHADPSSEVAGKPLAAAGTSTPMTSLIAAPGVALQESEAANPFSRSHTGDLSAELNSDIAAAASALSGNRTDNVVPESANHQNLASEMNLRATVDEQTASSLPAV